MKISITFCCFHVASAYSVLVRSRQNLICRNSFGAKNVDNNVDCRGHAKCKNVLIDCNSPLRSTSAKEVSVSQQQLLPRRKAIMNAAVLLSSLEVFVRRPNKAFAETEDKKNTYLNTYPGGNQLKSLKSMGGLPKKIRSICRIMDELQRDLMQERWDLVEAYPAQLRSYVPIFTAYTDTAFSGDEPAYKGLRIALRYEVGRFFAAVERLKAATNRKDLNASYVAYADMALHFDRYLNVGNLYTYRDDTVSLEKYFAGIDNSQLVYADPKKNPAEVRDLIVLISGPDKGRTGIMIGIYPDGSNNCVVKLDRSRSKSGIREIRVVPRLWAAKRLGEQDPDDVFLIPRKTGAGSNGA